MPGSDPRDSLCQLLDTMRILRSPAGCPWDREQTPESLTPYIMEEACEAIEAIEHGSPHDIAGELGDLLLQIVFQAEIFAERGLFDFADIAAAINTKLIRRHPHVFEDNARQHQSRKDLDSQWERIKREEQAEVAGPSLPQSGQIPVHLPSLQRAQKLLGKMHRDQLDIESILPVHCNQDIISEEQLGANLLALVSQAYVSGLDAEQSLRRAIRKITLKHNL